ncbi:MAG: alpha/beta fold hydrolase, partial [Terriglobales bacterium]
YAHVQRTEPQTLAVGLSDSPAGLAAWMAQRFRDWSPPAPDILDSRRLDHILANFTLYWLTGTTASSCRLYRDMRSAPLRFGPGDRIQVPTAVALFPHELPMPPRSWVERGFALRRWTEMPRGGHFAALDEPELMAQDLRGFFRPLRA